MSAPVLWIVVPLIVAGLLLLLRNQNASLIIACFTAFFLMLAAWIIPFDTTLSLGSLAFKLTPTLSILGRRLSLVPADRAFLALIYGSTFFWFAPAASTKVNRRLMPFGLAITSLLVAAIAVEPFLYAALLIETAVLISIPLLLPTGGKPGKGLIRFLIYQTLAFPFILFSGWILAGIEANPGNLTLVKQAAIFLGFGFAFLLAVFPFHTWIPLLGEEVHPYILGFILWMLPTGALFFALGFLDHYTWLRDTPALKTILTTAGLLMVLSGGIFAAFQRHLGRIFGYAVIVEIGFSLLAVSLVDQLGITAFLLLLVPRTLVFCTWVLSLSIIQDHTGSLALAAVRGFARRWPFAAIGVVLANLAVAGVPLLALFPAHQAIWEHLAQGSLPVALCVFIGSIGLGAAAVRAALAFVSTPEGSPWSAYEARSQRALLMLGWAAMFLLGLFPQWLLPLWTKLPALFAHLGQ